jgi:excisionase family DNA binding protein
MWMDAILCSIPDAAQALGLGRSKLYELITAGSIETVTIGRRRLVRVATAKAAWSMGAQMKAPGAAATAPGATIVGFGGATAHNKPNGSRRASASGQEGGNSVVLFDQPYRGDVWRLEVTTHKGRTFGNWRKWYRDGEALLPTREGVTIPLERFPELHASIGDYLASAPPGAALRGV